MKKISVFLFAVMILLTSTICFAAKGYVQNGYWMGDKNYPVIKYYGENVIEVANKKTVQKNYLLQPSNERVIKIETALVQLADNLVDSDAFYFKVVGNNIYFVNHNASAGMPKINWKLLDKNKNPEAWSSYQIATEVLTSSAEKPQEIYCGTMNNGNKVYLITKSIKASYFRKDVTEINCTVKIVMNGKEVEINHYQFVWDWDIDSWKYSSGGRPVKLTKNDNIAWNVFVNAKKYC